MVFAAGNSADLGETRISYPANQPTTLAIGAINSGDLRWNYSCWGEEMDLVAYSGHKGDSGDVWSADRMGKVGVVPSKYISCPPFENQDDYQCRFGGTSAAVPVVSGVASLILSKDSTLTALQVYEVLRESAANPLWYPTGEFGHWDEYGYGRVDAFRAILALSRCDLNNDGESAEPVDLSFMVENFFSGGPDPFPDLLLGDCNCDGEYDPVDMAWLAENLFGTPQTEVYPCFEF